MASKKDSKNRALKKGESERTDGRYQYRYTDLDGKRKTVYGKTLKELREKEKEIERSLLNNVSPATKNITLAQLFENFIETKTGRPATEYAYSVKLKTLKKFPISRKSINTIKEMDVRNFVKSMNQTYASGTIKELYASLKAAMDCAVADGLVFRNPFQLSVSTMVKSKPKFKKDALTDEQFDRLLELSKVRTTRRYVWLPYLLIFMRETGLRVGEVCGLTLSDIDLENRTLDINKQVITIPQNQTLKIGEPKTKSSKAVIPMTKVATEAAKEIIRLSKHGDFDGYKNFFISSSNGHVMTPIKIDQMFISLKKKYEEQYPDDEIAFTPHILRHTAATRMIKQGFAPSFVQAMLRHSDPNITLRLYTHINSDSLIDAFKERGI